MTADITQVVGATAANRQSFGIVVLLYVDTVIRTVRIVFYTEHGSVHQVVVFSKLHIARAMDFFSSTDNFIRAGVINVFDKVR